MKKCMILSQVNEQITRRVIDEYINHGYTLVSVYYDSDHHCNVTVFIKEE